MRKILAGAILLATFSASAIDAPRANTVHNTKDNGWLTYECEPVQAERLTCDFTQVLIRKKLKEAELESKYGEMLKGLESDVKAMDEETCSFVSSLLDVLHGGPGTGLPPEAKQKVQQLNAMQRKDWDQQFSALLETCQTKKAAAARRLVRLGLEIEARTCLVSTNRYKQTFRPVKGPDGKLISWTYADTSPQGDCGFVQMSRFVPARNISGTSIVLWNYVGKRATSNPEARTLFDFSCKEWDESETVYDWNSEEIPLQCDYIEHSPI